MSVASGRTLARANLPLGLGALPVLASLWLLVACSASPPLPERPSLITPLRESSKFQSPARWRYHPEEANTMLAAQRVTDSQELYVGDGGERWLESKGKSFATPASSLAPEPLVSANRLGAEAWLFVGKSGTTYQSRTPLGAFERVQSPPEPLVEVAAHGSTILGVNKAAQLLRSPDAGASWRLVPVAGRVVDVALVAGGHGLALLAPEQLLKTEDHGASWHVLDVEPFGAVRLRETDSSVLVESFLRSRSYVPTANPPWQKRHPFPEPKLKAEVRGGPDASALVEGRAVLTGDYYFELNKQNGHNWSLLSGPEFGPYESTSLSLSCGSAQLRALDHILFLACAKTEEGLTPITFYKSVDEGKNWERSSLVVRGEFSSLRWVVLANQTLVLSGICPEKASGPGCKPYGVHKSQRMPADEEHKKPYVGLIQVPAPGLRGPALELVLLRDGLSVGFVGRRTKGDSLGVFISDPGVNSVTVRDIEQLEVLNRGQHQGGLSLEAESLSVGDAGQLTLVVKDNIAQQRLIAVLEEDGRFVGLNSAPTSDSRIGTYGLKALAVSVGSAEVWESFDGGASWDPVGQLPGGRCAQKKQECVLYCHALGCVIGGKLSRVGWKDQQRMVPLHAIAEDFKPPPVPKGLKTPISCRVDEGSDWSKLFVSSAPGASEAAIGEAQWFVTEVNLKTGHVVMAEAHGGKLERAELFKESSSPRQTSLYVSGQIEGAIALRQVEGQRVELAWRNLLEASTTRRAQFAAGVRVDTRVSAEPTRQALPWTLSIATGGAFAALGPHAEQRFFFSNTGHKQPLRSRSWVSTLAKGHDEFVRVHDQTLFVRMVGRGLGMARMTQQAGEWVTNAEALGFLRPAQFGLNQTHSIAYLGNQVGYHRTEYHRGGSSAAVYPITAEGRVFGAPVLVPTQSQLPAEPKPCPSSVKKATPRVLSRPEAMTRHPILIADAVELMPVMLTAGAVLHGTVEQPCVATWEAVAVESGENEHVSALIDLHPKSNSWVFRPDADVPGRRRFEFRPMTCAWDPGAPVPPSAQAALEAN